MQTPRSNASISMPAKPRSPSGPMWGTLALGSLSTLLWTLFSSALIILNKDIYRMGFHRPFFVTGMGQLFSFVGGLALVYSGSLPLRKLPGWRYVACMPSPVHQAYAL